MIPVNETLKVLKERRSIRKYKKEQVAPETLDAILDTAEGITSMDSAYREALRAAFLPLFKRPEE